jgi:hypothetical protein
MKLPTFVDIGPGRSGSTWLHEVLASHPQVGMSSVKETEFFNLEYERGIEWYARFFAHVTDAVAVGEISNNYYVDSGVAGRIQEHLPGVKLVIHLRDPYELLASFHAFGIRRGLTLPPLSQSLDEPVGRLMNTGYPQRERTGRLTEGHRVTLFHSVLLLDRLQPFLERFPPGQIYTLVFDRVRSEPAVLASEIFEYLGVDAGHRSEALGEVVNPTIVPRSRLMAAAAKTSAYYLRQVGGHAVLQRLHRSRAIKRFLFRAASTAPRSEIRRTLPGQAVKRIDTEIERLKERFPLLRDHWE